MSLPDVANVSSVKDPETIREPQLWQNLNLLSSLWSECSPLPAGMVACLLGEFLQLSFETAAHSRRAPVLELPLIMHERAYGGWHEGREDKAISSNEATTEPATLMKRGGSGFSFKKALGQGSGKDEQPGADKARGKEAPGQVASLYQDTAGSSSRGKDGLRRPGSPDWLHFDPENRPWQEVLKESQDPERQRKDLQRYKKNPLAYELVRDGATWTSVLTGHRKWMPKSAKKVLVLTGMGHCVGIIAFTAEGVLAEHAPLLHEGSLKQRSKVASEMRTFAAHLRQPSVGASGGVAFHVVHARDPESARYAKAYETDLKHELGGLAGRFQLHLYGPLEKYWKSRFNVVADPRTKTVQVLAAWQREIDHMTRRLSIAPGGPKWYAGFDHQVRAALAPDKLPPDVQVVHEHPHASQKEHKQLTIDRHPAGYNMRVG